MLYLAVNNTDSIYIMTIFVSENPAFLKMYPIIDAQLKKSTINSKEQKTLLFSLNFLFTFSLPTLNIFI